MIKIFSSLMIFALLGGCTFMHPTDAYKPVERKGHFSSISGSPVLPIKVPEGPLSLQQAIEIGLANNPEVSAFAWETTAAEARQDEAFAQRLPRIIAVGGYTHHLDEQRLLPVGQPGEPAILSRNIFSGDIVMSTPLFAGGRLINRVRAASLLQQAASYRLVRSREELVFNISSLFFSILAQRHRIESLEFSLQALEEHVKRIDELIAAQKAAKVDRMRTDVRMADVRQQLVREKNVMSIQRRALTSLLGLTDHAEEIELQGDLESKETRVIPDLETAISKALSKRGDYRAARSSLEAQALNVDIARSGHWPTVSLQGSYGGRWSAGSTTGVGDKYGDVGRVGLVLEMPLFEGGQIDAGVRQQRSTLAAEQQWLRSLELKVRLEIETALLSLESSLERVKAIQKSIAQAKESLRIEQQKYNLGKGVIVDVLDAQAALLEAETTYYAVLADFHTAFAQLRLAMGEE